MAAWSSGMIRPLGGRGRGFDSLSGSNNNNICIFLHVLHFTFVAFVNSFVMNAKFFWKTFPAIIFLSIMLAV